MLFLENHKLYGFEHLEKSLVEDFYKNKLHHSLLIIGSKGMGKATFAYKLSHRILDTKQNNKSALISKEYEIQNINPSNQTYKLLTANSHPDFFLVERRVNFKTKKLEKEIKVDTIREINDFMNLTPSLSDYKVIIIDSADEMNLNAQNALLKTLEEPNENSFIILIAHNPNKLLDTIKSRCRQVYIKTLNYENWKNAVCDSINNKNMAKLDEEEYKTLSVISDNSIAFALDIIRLDGLDFYEKFLDVFIDRKVNIAKMNAFISEVKTNDDLFKLFEFFMSFLFKRTIKFSLNQKIPLFISKNEQKLIETIAIENKVDTIFGKFEYIKLMLLNIRGLNLDKEHCLGVIFNSIL
jgi:DNA polymerase III subunit delta'